MSDAFNTDASASRDGPHPIDRHVGLRIRMRRKEMSFSQEKLAEALGLTFQQVQKYERGANRVSASKLYEIARFLNAPVSYFFEGLADPTSNDPGDQGDGPEQFVHDFLMTPEGLELAATFPKIRKGRIRRRVLELVRTLADEDIEPVEE